MNDSKLIIIRQKMIMRSDCQANPNLLYIFGDNLERRGMGGQAKEMRGEANAFGIATKRKMAHGTPDCYMWDAEEDAWKAVQDDFTHLRARLRHYEGVVIPADGIGTGLAKLPEYAPQLLKYINDKLNTLGE